MSTAPTERSRCGFDSAGLPPGAVFAQLGAMTSDSHGTPAANPIRSRCVHACLTKRSLGAISARCLRCGCAIADPCEYDKTWH